MTYEMSENLKDILSNLNQDVDQETLLRYLQEKLSAEEQHELEKQMIDSDFDSDALEGLQNFKNKKDIAALVENLNKDLKRRTEKKERFREKLKLNTDTTVIIAIIILLLLIVLSYMIIQKQAANP